MIEAHLSFSQYLPKLFSFPNFLQQKKKKKQAKNKERRKIQEPDGHGYLKLLLRFKFSCNQASDEKVQIEFLSLLSSNLPETTENKTKKQNPKTQKKKKYLLEMSLNGRRNLAEILEWIVGPTAPWARLWIEKRRERLHWKPNSNNPLFLFSFVTIDDTYRPLQSKSRDLPGCFHQFVWFYQNALLFHNLNWDKKISGGHWRKCKMNPESSRLIRNREQILWLTLHQIISYRRRFSSKQRIFFWPKYPLNKMPRPLTNQIFPCQQATVLITFLWNLWIKFIGIDLNFFLTSSKRRRLAYEMILYFSLRIFICSSHFLFS